ncbi:MAG: hypothetical protein L6V88_09485 [Anaerotruncus sp.]|nr:MAG: hypothetical protein L6V88_09485 [Anaerotruncus sp.]
MRLLRKNKHFPDNSLIIGVPAKAVAAIDAARSIKIAEKCRSLFQKKRLNLQKNSKSPLMMQAKKFKFIISK